MSDYSEYLVARASPFLEETVQSFPGAVGVATAHIEALPYEIPPQTEALVITSANALPMLKTPSYPLIVVGEHTAKAARRAGHHVICVGEGNSEEMAQKMVSTHLPFKHVCHLHGVTYQKDWYNICIKAGLKITEKAVYRLKKAKRMPQSVSEKIKTGDVHSVILFSVQSAENLISMLSLENIEPESLSAIAISERVERVSSCFKSVKTAETPTRDALKEKIQELT